MENFLHNPDFIASLCGGGMFVVVVLIWQALIERDSVPADRLKHILERKSELQEVQQKKISRRVSIQRMGLMKQVVNWFKLTRGKGFQDLRLKLGACGLPFARRHVRLYVFQTGSDGRVGFCRCIFPFCPASRQNAGGHSPARDRGDGVDWMVAAAHVH